MAKAKGAWVGMAALVLTVAMSTGCGSDEDRKTAQQNLEKWQANGPKKYVYVVKTGCLCAHNSSTRVVVIDDAVKSAINDESGAVADGQTMTELLKSIVAEASRDNDTFEAHYDPTLGYLTSLFVDHSSASDDEYGKTVPCFAEGTGDDVCPLP